MLAMFGMARGGAQYRLQSPRIFTGYSGGGQRGARVQAIVNELYDEKVDIIPYSDDPVVYITNALSPAKVSSVKLDRT